jgi:hypothetical protein
MSTHSFEYKKFSSNSHQNDLFQLSNYSFHFSYTTAAFNPNRSS